ncbi:MAG: response regulator [Flavisolibacter sp.]|jgi:DNA-binding NarL/FixJ family response regulator|nr:response regulator [Flavisolibacter sp.]
MIKKQFIYIVDDDNDDREILRDAFLTGHPDFEYILLENGDQLLEHLIRHIETAPPGLILLDLNMPGKDGRETLKELKSDKRYCHIPILIFTTSSSPRDRRLAYEFGANCFISKPDTFNKLVEFASCVSKLWLP